MHMPILFEDIQSCEKHFPSCITLKVGFEPISRCTSVKLKSDPWLAGHYISGPWCNPLFQMVYKAFIAFYITQIPFRKKNENVYFSHHLNHVICIANKTQSLIQIFCQIFNTSAVFLLCAAHLNVFTNIFLQMLVVILCVTMRHTVLVSYAMSHLLMEGMNHLCKMKIV